MVLNAKIIDGGFPSSTFSYKFANHCSSVASLQNNVNKSEVAAYQSTRHTPAAPRAVFLNRILSLSDRLFSFPLLLAGICHL